jgi:hypothetical protein
VIGRQDVAAALDRLATVYAAPKVALPTLGDVWVRALAGIEPRELHTAVDRYLQSSARFFPKPGEIRALIPRQNGDTPNDGTLAGRYHTWQQGSALGDGAPCPVCGSTLAQDASGRLTVLHDHQQHVEAGIAYVGPRTGPVDREGRMLAATGPREDRWETP